MTAAEAVAIGWRILEWLPLWVWVLAICVQQAASLTLYLDLEDERKLGYQKSWRAALWGFSALTAFPVLMACEALVACGNLAVRLARAVVSPCPEPKDDGPKVEWRTTSHGINCRCSLVPIGEIGHDGECLVGSTEFGIDPELDELVDTRMREIEALED